MTWLRSPATQTRPRTLHLFFNRDERKTRGRAIPPHQLDSGVLAPIDSDAQGSWLAISPNGFVVALLNRWHENPPPISAPKSRGELPLLYAEQKNIKSALSIIENTDFNDYRPFTLVFIDFVTAHQLDWNGSSLSYQKPVLPLTSSSFCFEKIKAKREFAFSAIHQQHADNLRKFHSGMENNNAETIRMNRPDAQTWSRSEIILTDDSCLWHYDEELLDFQQPPQRHTLYHHV